MTEADYGRGWRYRAYDENDEQIEYRDLGGDDEACRWAERLEQMGGAVVAKLTKDLPSGEEDVLR